MKASEILASAQVTLFDAAGAYWPLAELVQHLNEQRLRLMTLRPDLYEQIATVALAAGTEQSLPAGMASLLRVLHNVSHPDKYAITVTSEEQLARVRPRWRAMTRTDEVEHLLYTETAPQRFEVYPPVRAGVSIRLAGPVAPAPVLLGNLDVELAQERELAVFLIDAVLARAFAKEGDGNVAALQRSATHDAAFLQGVNAEGATKAGSSPNKTAPGPVPAGGVGQ